MTQFGGERQEIWDERDERNKSDVAKKSQKLSFKYGRNFVS